MYTKAMITEMFQNDVASTREWRKQYKADYEQIEKTFNETRDPGPKKTVEALIDRIGYDRAQAVVATMINSIGSWDGRIDDRNRAWAKTIDEAFDKEAANDAYMYCSIHSCHADQIADEMRRAERPIETVEDETVEAEAEDATETATEAKETIVEAEEDKCGETLYLERRGCEFNTDRPDGIGIKKPVRELVKADALHVSTQYTPKHLSYRDSVMEIGQWADPEDYAERSILDFVNRVSTKHYSRIEYVYTFDVEVGENRNFTPRQLIHEWAKENRIPEKDGIFQACRVELYSGLYEYGHWKISDRDTWGNHAKPGNVFVTIFLKKSAV